MNTLKFESQINAPKEKVWETLWNDDTYPQWTAAFMEGSYAKSDWKEGSEILFLGPGGDGMFAVIETKIPFEQMSFKHEGEIKNGVKDPKDWGGAKENYYLQEDKGVTALRVELNTPGGEMEEYFKETFPKALDRLKEIAEQ